MLRNKNLIFIINGREVNGSKVFSSLVKAQYESLKNNFAYSKIIVLTNNNNFFSFLKNIIVLRKTIPQNSIVHAQYGTVTALTAALVKKNNPLIISYCGDDLIPTSRKELIWQFRSLIGRLFSILAGVFANRIIAKSANIISKVPLFLLKKCVVLPNGVNREVFFPMPKLEAQQMLNWHKQEKYILFNPSSGNNRYVKNLPLALQIVNEIKKKTRKINFILIENCSPQKINLMMNAADCLLVTSFHEGSPNIVKEAMATNLPIVSVDCGDTRDRLTNVSNSFVTDTYDISELSICIEKVLKLGGRSNGRNALSEDKLFSDQIALKLLDIYKDLI